MKMAKTKGNAWYYNISRLLRIIIAIIPITAWIVHAIARITSGKLLGLVVGIICLFGVGLIVWVIDLITVLFMGKLFLA